MSSDRSRRVAVLSAVAAVLMGSAVAVSAAPCAEVSSRSDGWTEISPSSFADTSGETEIVSYAVAAADPMVLYVSNGTTILGSTDGGCTWKDIYSTDRITVGQIVTAPTRRVVALDVPPRQPNRLYVLVMEVRPGSTGPQVLMSDDRGATFRQPVAGLPVTGLPGRLALSLRDDVAYVTVDGAVGTGPSDVYATEDGGNRWTLRGSLPAAAGSLAVDPRVGNRLWAVVDGHLHRSDDGGATFESVDQAPQRVSDVAAGLSETSTRLVAPRVDSGKAYHSGDDGDTWTQLSSPPGTTSAAVVDRLPLVAFAGGGAVRVDLNGGEYTQDISPVRADPQDLRFTTITPTGLSLFARSGQVLLRMSFTPLGTVLKPGVPPADADHPPVDIGEVNAPPLEGATLLPAETALTLRPGESRTVKYALSLPPVPTPLDVVFVFDTTGSMGGAIDGLRAGIGDIVRTLADGRIDAQFGVADFKDYPIGAWGTPGDFPYKRLRDLGPADDELEGAIEQLQEGGGGDGPESLLPALYQAATGRGEMVGAVPIIEPGKGMTFRPGSLRVAVAITDAPAHREPGYPGPTYDATVAALRERNIRQVGIAVTPWARTDLEAIAEDTGTYAPPGGADCNDDGRADLKAGEPLVCTSSGKGLAPAIVGLLHGIRDEAEIAAERTGADVLTVVTPATEVNVRVRQRLPFAVRVACKPEHHGKTVRSGVRAVSRGRTLVSAGVSVTCLAPPVEGFAQPVERPPIAAAIAPLAPPAPAPNPNPQPNPNPNPQTAPQANAQPQPGVAVQDQQKVQLALAEAESGVDWELAMSSRHQETDPALLWAAASMFAAGAAVAAQRRRSPATQSNRF